MLKQQLSGKVATITGAASGIGRATALLFASEGAAVVITDVNESGGRAVVAEIVSGGGRAIFEPGDVTQAADCKRVIERAMRDFGGIHVLFNNAGIIRRASVVELSEADWDRVMAVNVKAIFLMSREAIPMMEKNGGGCIINTASGWGLAGGPRSGGVLRDPRWAGASDPMWTAMPGDVVPDQLDLARMQADAHPEGPPALARPHRIACAGPIRIARHPVHLSAARASQLLSAHQDAVRRELARSGGREVKTLGDGCLAILDGPARAIRCGQAIVEAASSAGLRVRIGLHSGEVELVGNDVAGIAVHIASRIGALAAGGEVLVSSTVKDLVAGSGIRFEDRGTNQLKGISDEWRLFRAEP